ncbi:MAG: type IX secretion system sortase PorU [Bacteroidota bacterium]
MMNAYYLSLVTFLLLATTPLNAQQTLEYEFEWPESPLVIEYNGERQVRYSLEGELEGPWPMVVRSWRAAGSGELQVRVIEAEYEDFSPHPLAKTDLLSDDIQFETSVSRQPEGYLAKVGFVPVLRSTAGYQRLKSIKLEVDRSPAPGQARSNTFANRSVLADGQVYQIAVSQTGIHKLTRGFLTGELGMNLDGVDPRQIRLYGQGGGMIPEVVGDEFPDDLPEQPIWISGESDGNFDGDDAIYFYGEAADKWAYNSNGNAFAFEQHLYDDLNYYYLKIEPGNGRRVAGLSTSGSTTYTTDSYEARYIFEEEEKNIMHELSGASGSGRSWYGDFFRVSREQNYGRLFEVPDFVSDVPAALTVRMGVRADVVSRFNAEVNGEVFTSSSASRVTFGREETSQAVYPRNLSASFDLNQEDVNIKVIYPTPSNSEESEAWLDYIQLIARRRLVFNGSQMDFRDRNSRLHLNTTFQLSNLDDEDQVWRVGDANTIGRVNLQGSNATVATGDAVHEFVVFRPGNQLLQAEAVGEVVNQDLHGIQQADMVIITHKTFRQNAERLAEHRRSFNGFDVVLVDVEEVYNEFSGGKDDAGAIRNFAHMIWERDPDFRYLLLLGDGSFDHRDIYGFGNNFIPVYGREFKYTEVEDFPADDFFGIFSASNSRLPLEPDLNIAVGRLPVKSAAEAKNVIDKLIAYDTAPEALGDWRTRMVFVGDDEDNSQHTDDVDEVARSVATRRPDLNFDKFYFDLFPQISQSAGDRFPAVTEGIDRAIFRGSLAITYLGHGGPRGWGQERVLSIPQIRNWRNPNQYPVFITATCTFASFDDANFVSAGEETLLTTRGGAAALLTTTRPVYANENKRLTDETVQAMLDRPDGEWRTLGDVIRIAKNRITTSGTSDLSFATRNARKFTLLGDPATVIALPTHGVRTLMVDGQPIDPARTDTARALQQVMISGEIVDVNGNPLTDFNGTIFPTVYDKPQSVNTLQQDPGSPARTFEVQRSIIFRGRATVRDGQFSFSFVVPRDINYSFGQVKISYYAADPAQRIDASGAYNELVIGGTDPNAVSDDQGPVVDVFMNDESFISGGEVGTEATLLVKLSDDLGINVTGNSIGHDLEAVIDEDTRNPIILNDYYEAAADDFRRGEVRFPLFDLEPGPHTISVRAWDVANNSATGSTDFVVSADGRAALTRVLNYPNPFSDRTCIQFDHTLTGQDVQVLVQIYTVSGRLVKTLEADLPFSDGTVRLEDCIEWDGRDDYGDQLARGVYLYQVRLKGEGDNSAQSDLQRMVILK